MADLIDRLMRDYAAPGGPGASVLVVRGRKLVVRRSYGLANLEEQVAATPDTHYRLASVTKHITAAAILSLKLPLDEPIARFFPALPNGERITIRHLLIHTSGLVDYEDVIPEGITAQLKDRDVLRLLEQQEITYFPPGLSYRYSNSGYALLALIVERVSGQSFAAYLRKRLFLPRRMRTTVAHEEGVSMVPNRAYGYSREGSGWRRTDQSLTSAVLGDGGVYTSINEMARWLRALDRGDFAEAAVPRVDTDKRGVRYGYGWRVSEHAGRRLIAHTGETRGFRNALVRFPDERLSVLILTNRGEGEPIEQALAIADAV